MTIILFYCCVLDGLVAFALLSITLYDLYLRINRINNTIINIGQTSSTAFIWKTTDKYIRDHNKLANKVMKLNNFWKSYILTMVMTVSPISLILLDQVLFENGDTLTKIVYIFALFFCYLLLFILQYFLASFSAKMPKMCKKLSHFQWIFKRRFFSLGFKLKLLMYFERLSSKQKKIGFSVGSLAVVTFPLFSGVSQ